jgi:hypothetical protein
MLTLNIDGGLGILPSFQRYDRDCFEIGKVITYRQPKLEILRKLGEDRLSFRALDLAVKASEVIGFDFRLGTEVGNIKHLNELYGKSVVQEFRRLSKLTAGIGKEFNIDEEAEGLGREITEGRVFFGSIERLNSTVLETLAKARGVAARSLESFLLFGNMDASFFARITPSFKTRYFKICQRLEVLKVRAGEIRDFVLGYFFSGGEKSVDDALRNYAAVKLDNRHALVGLSEDDIKERFDAGRVCLSMVCDYLKGDSALVFHEPEEWGCCKEFSRFDFSDPANEDRAREYHEEYFREGDKHWLRLEARLKEEGVEFKELGDDFDIALLGTRLQEGSLLLGVQGDVGVTGHALAVNYEGSDYSFMDPAFGEFKYHSADELVEGLRFHLAAWYSDCFRGQLVYFGTPTPK